MSVYRETCGQDGSKNNEKGEIATIFDIQSTTKRRIGFFERRAKSWPRVGEDEEEYRKRSSLAYLTGSGSRYQAWNKK
jgi:hypothetical protein